MRKKATKSHAFLRRLLLVVLCFVMCAGLLSNISFAEDTHGHTENCYSESGELVCTFDANDSSNDEEILTESSIMQVNSFTVNDFTSLKEAIANAEDGVEEQIQISNDIEFTETLTIPTGKIIALTDADKACEISANETIKNKYFIKVEEGGVLTINGNVTFDGKNIASFIECYGTVTVENATLINGHLGSSNIGGGVYVYGEKATFILNNGIIKNTTSGYANKAAVYVQDKAKFTMNGGKISDSVFDNQFCGAVVVDNSEFILNDGTISGNKCKEQIQSSGGVLVLAIKPYAEPEEAKESNFIMNGGKIINNEGFRGSGVYVYGGGLVYVDFYSKCSFLMNGGEISGNSSVDFSDLTAAGGGVYVEWNSNFVMNDGVISDNSTTGMGGGVATNDGFTHYFGKVPYSSAGNRNYKGNYYRDWPKMFPASFTMNGGSIVNNKAMSTSVIGDEGCGGGVYIASSKVVLNAGDISYNASGKQGGGVYVGSVPYILRMYDVVVTENNASVIGGGAWFCPTSDIDLFVNDGGALFGNSAAGAGDDLVAVHNTTNYHATIADRMLGGGAHNWYQDGAIDVTGVLGYADTSVPRYDENRTDNVSYSNIYYSNEPYSIKAIPTAEAQKLAKSLAKLTITNNSSMRGGGIGSNGGVVMGKSYEGTRDITVNKEWIGGTDIPDSVTLWLVINGYRTEKIVVTKAENWTATVTGLPTGRDIVITIEEDPINNWQPSYKYATAPSGDMTATVVNTRDTGNLTVTKTVSGTAADSEQLFDFTVTLDDNTITGTFGEMIFTDGVAEFKLKDGESKTAEGLPAGVNFTVNENNEDYEVTKTGETGVIVADKTLIAEFNNHKDGRVNVTVKKIWEDNNSSKRPESIKVQLYKDGEAYGDPVELNERNRWKAEWNDLLDTFEWTVDEIGASNGYKKTVQNNGNDWVITNSLEEVPPTGDVFNVNIMIMISALSLVCLTFMLITKKIKKYN